MDNKVYICPKCGGSLSYWEETVHEQLRKINPITGKLQKTINRTIVDTLGNANEGLLCNKCGWCYNTISIQGSEGADIPEIFRNTDFSDNT